MVKLIISMYSVVLLLHVLLFLSSLMQWVLSVSHDCTQYPHCSVAVEVPNPTGANNIQLTSTSGSTIAFTFSSTLSGMAGYICYDLPGSCAANVGGSSSSLTVSYSSTNTQHCPSDLGFGFYGTDQSFRSWGCSCGSTSIGSLPGDYNTYGVSVHVTQAFNTPLASGFTAICLINTCGGDNGYCGDPNTFTGSFSVSNVICSYPSSALTTAPSRSPTSKPSASPTSSIVIVGSDSSSSGGLVTNILFWVFFILGLVIFFVYFYRKHWCPDKTVNYIAAFEELQRDDNTITENGHCEVVSLMSDYGVKAGEDFQELEDRDINLIASKLKKVPRNKFLKYLGRKWSGGDIPFDPVVVADDAITACDVEISSVNMNKSV